MVPGLQLDNKERTIAEPLPWNKGKHLTKAGSPLDLEQHTAAQRLRPSGGIPRPSSPADKRKVVADDFMYEFEYPVSLPTIDRLEIAFDDGTDPSVVTEEIRAAIASASENADAEAFAGLFLHDGVWRDKVVFTWEYRTFNGKDKILAAAGHLLASAKAGSFAIIDPKPCVEKPFADLRFIQAHFTFKTAVATGSAVANIIPTKSGIKIWTLHTVIEALNGFPELEVQDGHMTGLVSYKTQRERDIAEIAPEVVIVGGGHNGLMMAARLQYLGIKTLIIERNQRIGDNWRNRYEALSLHFPHWGDHLPYMPYPTHWPTYTPAYKMGQWLEAYADFLELNCWCSSSIVSSSQDTQTHEWTIVVNRNGEGERTLKPKHVIMATSLAGIPMMPTLPGAKKYKGAIRHSTEHTSSREWVGKKVMVVGTSSSGFDTAYDFARRGVDVTILQRSPTYIMSLTESVPMMLNAYKPTNGKRPDLEAVDRIAYSMPVGPGEELGRRMARKLAGLDRELLEGLEKAGFKTYLGQRETGVQTLGYTRNGGFYFDAGACEQIINGNIKVKQGSVEQFTADKVVFADGSEDYFDLIVMATGFSNTIDSVRATMGDDVADRCGLIWGMDKEGELNSAWKSTGIPNFWLMVGTLQHGRYHSKTLALRIKAQIEGVAGLPYTL